MSVDSPSSPVDVPIGEAFGDLPDDYEFGETDVFLYEELGLTPPAVYEYRSLAHDGGDEWLADAIEEYLGVYVTDAQRAICRSLAGNQHSVVVTANGLGKSFILAAVCVAWQIIFKPAKVLVTSGTYSKLDRTFCRPIEQLHGNAFAGMGAPGTYKHRPPKITFEDRPDSYFEATSPSDPGEIMGVHSKYTLGVIEEADKQGITREVIDAMLSLVTDDRDRLILIANPPDETHPLRDLTRSELWNTVRLSSFDSHNVQIDLGEIDGSPISGIASLEKIRSDWVQYNDEPWPGITAARNSGERRDLDARWYRHRLGVLEPVSAAIHRPFNVDDVDSAFADVSPSAETATPRGIGLDVARMGGDSNALVGVFGDQLTVLDTWDGTNHNANEARVSRQIRDEWDCSLAVDAAGEGSGLGDRLSARYPSTTRFNAGQTASQEEEYYNRWSEGLAALGEFLRDGGTFDNRRLREELLTAARVVEFDSRFIKSRGRTGSEVLQATSKDAIKQQLGRSPDVLDAAVMAAWCADDATSSGKKRRRDFTWTRW